MKAVGSGSEAESVEARGCRVGVCRRLKKIVAERKKKLLSKMFLFDFVSIGSWGLFRNRVPLESKIKNVYNPLKSISDSCS